MVKGIVLDCGKVKALAYDSASVAIDDRKAVPIGVDSHFAPGKEAALPFRREPLAVGRNQYRLKPLVAEIAQELSTSRVAGNNSDMRVSCAQVMAYDARRDAGLP